MKSSSNRIRRRLRSGLLLGVLSACSLTGACLLPVCAQAEGASGEESSSQPPMVHSRSAQRVDAPASRDEAGNNSNAQPASLTLKSGVSYTVPKGTAMNLKITSVPSNGMRLLQKDLEGNPEPSHVNDIICAMITEDIYVDGDRVIPEGTVFRGRVTNIHGPRRVQRPGWVDITFDELQLPDGRLFRFRAQADNLEASTLKSKAHAVGMIAANAAGGAIVGTAVAYQLFGMHYTITCKGYNLAAGAAGGALLAAGHAIMKRGHKAWLEPGDGLNLSIDTDMVMPALQAPTKHVSPKLTNLEGLSIDVLKCKIVKNGLGGYFYRLDVNINNDSDQELQSIDLFLRDSLNTKSPLAQGPEDEDKSAFLFRLEPNTSIRSRIYFDVEHPKLPQEFVWLDHQNRKKVCFRQRLEL
jgi:hypothetical protein